MDKGILAKIMAEEISKTQGPPLSFLKGFHLKILIPKRALADEFNEFLRATDAGELSDFLLEKARNLKDSFARSESTQVIEAFIKLENTLAEKAKEEIEKVYVSRLHVLRNARQLLATSWAPNLEVNQVLISNISFFDASTLRLINEIERVGSQQDINFKIIIFTGEGTYNQLLERINKTKTFSVEQQPESKNSLEKLEEYFRTGSLEFISFPERRREVEGVAIRTRKLLQEGVHPSKILLVAKDCGKYLSLVTQIFPAYGISYSVQTRRPYAHLPPYRFVKATLELIVAAESGRVHWNQITDPLRLGFCLPYGRRIWPIQPKQFIALEDCLSRAQRTQGPLSLPEWQAVASTRVYDWYAKEQLLDFLAWIDHQVNNVPKDPIEARYLIAELLEHYMLKESTWIRKAQSLASFDEARFKLLGFHPTHFASKIRASLKQVEDNLKDCIDILNQKMSWGLVNSSFGIVFGSETYGLPRQDLSSVRIVDAGNSEFLSAEHVFILGMRADEFPRACPKGIFIPDELRDSTAVPNDGEDAFLILRNRSNNYATELDYLESILRSVPKAITCSMPYHDEKNHVIDWSSFIDKFDPANHQSKHLPNEWLPTFNGKNWTEFIKACPPWVRQRLYCYHSFVDISEFPMDQNGLSAIASSLDSAFFETHLSSRIQQYRSPPLSVEVSSDEPWFSKCSLEAIIGSPFRVNELDLHGTCPMQFYLYQFLYLWDGPTGIERDTLPENYKGGNYRFGRLPRKLLSSYPSAKTDEALRRLVAAFPDRQHDFSQFSDVNDLINKLTTILDDFEAMQMSSSVIDEFFLVRQERLDNIARQWSWGPENALKLTELPNVEIILPSHRVDALQRCKLIVVYVNYSQQLLNRNTPLVYSKQRGKMPPIRSPLRDYRVPVLLTYYQSFIAGAVYVELFDGIRRGYYNLPFLTKHKGRQSYQQELKMPISTLETSKQLLNPEEWKCLIDSFKQAIIDQVNEMKIKNGKALFAARSSEVNCSRCIYDTLCQIPRSERSQW